MVNHAAGFSVDAENVPFRKVPSPLQDSQQMWNTRNTVDLPHPATIGHPPQVFQSSNHGGSSSAVRVQVRRSGVDILSPTSGGPTPARRLLLDRGEPSPSHHIPGGTYRCLLETLIEPLAVPQLPCAVSLTHLLICCVSCLRLTSPSPLTTRPLD